jgi:hypothetical protein
MSQQQIYASTRAKTLGGFYQYLLSHAPSANGNSGGMSTVVTEMNTISSQVLAGTVTPGYCLQYTNLKYHQWSQTGYFQAAGFLQDLRLYTRVIGLDPAMWDGLDDILAM